MPIHTRSTWTHGLRISRARTHATLHMTATTSTTTLTTALVVNMDIYSSNMLLTDSFWGAPILLSRKYIDPFSYCTRNVKILILFFKIFFPLFFSIHRWNIHRFDAQAYVMPQFLCSITCGLFFSCFAGLWQASLYLEYILDVILSTNMAKLYTSLGIALIFGINMCIKFIQFIKNTLEATNTQILILAHTFEANLLFHRASEFVCVFVCNLVKIMSAQFLRLEIIRNMEGC